MAKLKQNILTSDAGEMDECMLHNCTPLSPSNLHLLDT